MLALVLCAVLTAQTQEGLQETITVSRVLVDVRATKYGGEPITDLTAADFDVRIGGKRAVVESAEWIWDAVEEAESFRRRADDEDTPPSPRRAGDATTRRLIVLFVQTDFARVSSRVSGHMSFLPYARELVSTFDPEDRVAVFSFDSHLKFRLDFSSDREAIHEALNDTLWIDHPPPPPAVPEPSLGPRMDRQAMRRAAHSETGLLLVANALKAIPGPKSLLLLGWGLGELTPAGVKMKWQWDEARAALEAARVSIFALDTTDADAHDLEVGLKIAADQTGGFYEKTHLFPRIAIERVRRTLSGRYELVLRGVADLKPGTHALTVRVKKRSAIVLAPTSVLIRR